MNSSKIEQFFSEYDTMVLTGGSSGIGAALIKAIKNLNAVPDICNISRTEPDPGLGDIHHITCDLSDYQQLVSAVEDVKTLLKNLPHESSQRGKVLLVNNSGFGAYGPFPEPGLGHNLSMMDVNMRACVALTAELLPILKERGGAVVNISSTAAMQPTPQLATYGATKAFVLHWSMALHEDLRGSGVHCLAVCPGPTNSNFFKAAGFDNPPHTPGNSQTAEQVAMETLNALVKGKTLVVCGRQNKIVSAISTKLPKTWSTRLAAMILRRVRAQ